MWLARVRSSLLGGAGSRPSAMPAGVLSPERLAGAIESPAHRPPQIVPEWAAPGRGLRSTFLVAHRSQRDASDNASPCTGNHFRAQSPVFRDTASLRFANPLDLALELPGHAAAGALPAPARASPIPASSPQPFLLTQA